MMSVCAPLRLAEAAGVLSLASDLAMGQPLEHGMRTAVLGVRTAAAMGLSEQDHVAVFYTGVLHFAGCTAESEIDARFFGNELAARPQMMAALFGPRLGVVALRWICGSRSDAGSVSGRRGGNPPPVPVARATELW
jgi:hypothetical protein